MRKKSLAVLGATLGIVLIPAAAASASPKDPGGEHKVTICHRTNSEKNPYVIITVDRASVDGTTKNGSPHDDHSHHLGDPFNPGYDYPSNAKDWGDIIPDAANGGVGAGLNWDENGRAIWDAGCNVPDTPIPVGGVAGTVIALTAAGGYVVYRQRRNRTDDTAGLLAG